MFPQDGDTPVHNAARRGEEDVVKVLVEKGANITAVNNVSYHVMRCSV